MKAKFFLAFTVTVVLTLTACLPGLIIAPTNQPAPTLSKDQMDTAVVQTVGIRQTISVLETRIGAFTSVPSEAATLQATATRTLTPTSSPTPTPAATSTPLPPTITSTSATPCNAAAFVSDISFPDGQVVDPGQTVIKTWRIKNIGACGWNSSYSLVFASGSKMGGPDVVAFPTAGVKPGETIDLTVNLTAPTSSGDYAGFWQLKGPDGDTFGVNVKNQPFWVKIKVGTTTLNGTSLIDNYCSAVWKNSTTSLPCPAPRADFSAGSVFRMDNPKLEGAYQDNEPALVMIPNNGSGGQITGTFPAFKVQSGDHFISLIGCMDNIPKCSVTFKLSYTIDGSSVTDLLTWDHNYTGSGSWKRVDVDLTSLAGQSIKFILTVTNHDDASVDDQAFWLKPYVKR
jgi:hypothetical protein